MMAEFFTHDRVNSPVKELGIQCSWQQGVGPNVTNAITGDVINNTLLRHLIKKMLMKSLSGSICEFKAEDFTFYLEEVETDFIKSILRRTTAWNTRVR